MPTAVVPRHEYSGNAAAIENADEAAGPSGTVARRKRDPLRVVIVQSHPRGGVARAELAAQVNRESAGGVIEFQTPARIIARQLGALLSAGIIQRQKTSSAAPCRECYRGLISWQAVVQQQFAG